MITLKLIGGPCDGVIQIRPDDGKVATRILFGAEESVSALRKFGRRTVSIYRFDRSSSSSDDRIAVYLFSHSELKSELGPETNSSCDPINF